ncbi:MAG TPA: glutaredoxin family protein [Ktedonobacterales bacterium]|nr:glutaredoxin family protein [Ktedonobacterales bacterium]
MADVWIFYEFSETPITLDELSSPATKQHDNIVMYTTSWCGDCRRSKKLFAALNIPYTEIDIEQRPEAAEIVRQLNHGMQSVPTILFPDGSVLVEPSNTTLEAKLAPFVAA